MAHAHFFASSDEVQVALYDAGAVPGFVRLLSSGNDQAELKSLTALVNLSGNGECVSYSTSLPII